MKKIDYNNLKCRDCGVILPHPKSRRTFSSLSKIQCSECRARVCRDSGRIPMLHNVGIQVTPMMKQVIYGSLLGDGSLEAPPKGSLNWGLAFKHCAAQDAYARSKAELLGALCSKISYVPISDREPQTRVRTVRHPYFTELATSVIVDNRRSVTDRILQEIDPLGLAIWYADDGSLLIKANKKAPPWVLIRIATCNFTVDENDALIAMLQERFGIEAHRRETKGKGKSAERIYQNIHIFGKEAEKFLALTSPYAKILEMEYKWLSSLS